MSDQTGETRKLEQLGIKEVQLCDGLTIHNRARLSTVREMEQYFKMPFHEFGKGLDLSSMNVTVMFIYYLAKQCTDSWRETGVSYKKMTEKYVENKLEDIQIKEGNLNRLYETLLAMLGIKINDDGKITKTDENDNSEIDITEKKTVPTEKEEAPVQEEETGTNQA